MIILNWLKFTESLETDDIWTIIPNSVKDLHQIFKENGFKLYVVGGAIRDWTRNESPKDFDLCTDAKPEEVISMLKNRYKLTKHGESFGVVVVYTNDQPKGMEIATMREDIYGDELGVSRNPKVKFTTIDKDVERRDITFNALFYDLDTKKIVDLVGGLEDLKNGIVKLIGNPDLRIKEDPLRILRVLRFCCRYKFKLDENTEKSIFKNKSALKIITSERIWSISGENTGEIQKAWKQSKDFSDYMDMMLDLSIFEEISGNLIISKGVLKSDYLQIHLANLFRDNNKDILERYLVKNLKFENKLAREITFLLQILDLNENNFLLLKKKANIFLIEPQMILQWLELNKLHNGPLFKLFFTWQPSVSAEKLIKQGYKGVELGKQIEILEKERIRKLISS